MLILKYCKEGKLYSDFNLLESACDVIEKYKAHWMEHEEDFVVDFGTENFINAIRVVCKRTNFNVVDVRFIFNEEIILMDEYYMLDHWPKGFGDIQEKLMLELI